MEYLGYIISPMGIEMDPEKIKTVKDWKEPVNVKGIQSFLGFANFYRRFIRDFSKITTPLTKLTKKEVPWLWNDTAQQAFEQLKTAMISETILQHFDPDCLLTLETDTSDYAIGAVCSQPDNSNVLHPLGYFSRKLKDAELNYDIHDKELLAIVEALNKWSTYCKSTKHSIQILSDHKNLEYWQTKKDLNLRQACWAEQLANYDFKITYRPGELAGKPDILSRESGDSPWEGEMKHRQNRGRILLPEEVFCANGTQLITLTPDNSLIAKIREKTKLDKEIQEVVNKLCRGVTRDSKIPLGLCEEDNGLLLYEGLIWVPNNDELRLQILHEHHDTQAAGHPRRANTLELVSRNYYWPQQWQYVNRYVDYCDTCKRIKLIKHAPFGLLRPLQIPERLWESISMDFITGLPEEEGSNTIWVIIDHLMKMAHFMACVDTIGPKELADGFLTHVVRTHGLPSSVISDRGSLFTSPFWKRIMEAMGTSRTLSTAFHPESDGQMERINAILEQYLWAYCNYQHNHWKQLLPMAEFCYNNSQSETTKVSPIFANFGYHPRFTPPLSKVNEGLPEVSEYVGTLNKLHETLRAAINYAQTLHAEQANRNRHPNPVLRVGDRVWLKQKNVKTT
jgi:hypothetical protein